MKWEDSCWADASLRQVLGYFWPWRKGRTMSAKEDDKAEREAYIRGAKDFADEVRESAKGPRDIIDVGDLATAFWRIRTRLLRGEWPKGE